MSGRKQIAACAAVAIAGASTVLGVAVADEMRKSSTVDSLLVDAAAAKTHGENAVTCAYADRPDLQLEVRATLEHVPRVGAVPHGWQLYQCQCSFVPSSCSYAPSATGGSEQSPEEICPSFTLAAQLHGVSQRESFDRTELPAFSQLHESQQWLSTEPNDDEELARACALRCHSRAQAVSEKVASFLCPSRQIVATVALALDESGR